MEICKTFKAVSQHNNPLITNNQIYLKLRMDNTNHQPGSSLLLQIPEVLSANDITIEANDNEDTVITPSSLCRNFSGEKFTLNDGKFIMPTQISITINGIEYKYNRTKAYNGKIYFQCINRNRVESNGGKCLAKANYTEKKNSLKIVDLHSPNCLKNSISINKDYSSQRADILERCISDNNLSVVNALNYLRQKNMDATLEDKRQPLDYDQVKNIIRDFRDVNNINSDSSLSDYLLIRTIDGAIFRRCHNAYDMLY